MERFQMDLGDTVLICSTCLEDQAVNLLRLLLRARWPVCCGAPLQILLSDADVMAALASLAFRTLIAELEGEAPLLQQMPWCLEWFQGVTESPPER